MHHTKDKADIGFCKVITDLTMKGYVPCIPFSEHQAFDLVVVGRDGTTFRLQVKYSTLRKNGSVDVRYRRNWADRHGVHTRIYSKDEFDYYAIYCPEKDAVLYVRNTPDCPKSIRFDKPANNQMRHIKWANDYLKIKK